MIREEGMLLRIAARSSPLSLAQVEESRPHLQALLPGVSITVIPATTPGDRDQSTPLDAAGVPDDFFTRDLDRLLLQGEADLTIHSAKDLPRVLDPALRVAALRPAGDIRDAVVFRAGCGPEHPPRTVGTSSPARRQVITEHFPGAEAKPIRGTIQRRLEQLDAGDYDAVIVATCALHRLGLSRRIGLYLPVDPAPQQSRLAWVVRADRTDLLAALRPADVRHQAGMIALVGCPADLRLLAEPARRLLREADVVLHDRLLPAGVIESLGERGVSVGKEGGRESIPQSEIHRRLLAEAEAGKLVVRLHGGDPSILAHLGETLAFCAGWNLRVEVLPAVSAAQVASAHARAALTHRRRGRSIRLLTGHDAEGGDYETFSGPDQGNLAVYMGVRNRAAVASRLREAGWADDAPVVVAERLGEAEERLQDTTLGQMAGLDVRSPAVILVGVTAYPGEGYTLFTGTDPDLFLRHGPLWHLPMIRLVARPLEERRAALKAALPGWRGVIFPSRFAVEAFVEALLVDQDVRALAGKRLLAVGPATADALRRQGLRADVVAKGFGGVASLAEKITEADRGDLGYPCSDASPTGKRAAALAALGVNLCPLPFYHNQTLQPGALPQVPFSRVLFTSGSTVQAYFAAFPAEKAADRTWLAVGASTLAALAEQGLTGELLPG
jgi:hydroxymethylbilane synthase